MNAIFGTPHPSVPLFIETIEIESRRQVTRLDDIRHQRVVVEDVHPCTINEVPNCYLTFVPITDTTEHV